MGDFRISKIENLVISELSQLVEESKTDGFRFLERLVNDYNDGTNTFSEHGESLYGVYNENNSLIAVGGLNNDPLSNDTQVGRLRRFYVGKEYRRKAIGTLLLRQIIYEAKNYYRVLVLNTDTKQAANFYRAYGFEESKAYPGSTHLLNLGYEK